MHRLYFAFRRDLEIRILSSLAKANRSHPQTLPTGNHRPDVFLGYCAGNGKYLPMDIPEDYDMKTIYGF
jgi:hypothetical protein